jgi:hypothetical protein
MASVLTGAVAIVFAAVTAFAGATVTPASKVAGTALGSAAAFGFDAHGVAPVTAKQLGKSWHHGCPVPPRDLRALRVPFWGFDGARHTGVLIVRATAVHPVRVAFRKIRHAHFPIRRMVPISAYGGSDNKSMADDNTSAFNCRYAVANGPKSWSAHAYGDAVDINTRENPYRLNGKILPPSGAKYTDRSKHRRGMIFAHGPVVKAFDAVGWGWGGRWSSSPDYQHFSVNGR